MRHNDYFSLTSVVLLLLLFINSILSSENCSKIPFPQKIVLYLLLHNEILTTLSLFYFYLSTAFGKTKGHGLRGKIKVSI